MAVDFRTDSGRRLIAPVDFLFNDDFEVI